MDHESTPREIWPCCPHCAQRLVVLHPTSYRDINKSKVPFPKTEFFDAIDNGFNEAGIGTERDVEKHLRKRKFLTPAFTPAATKMYEPLVAPHLDSFLKEIEERGKLPEGVDFVEWYQFLTFDTAGDLAFGESFKALSMGVQHRWMSLVTESIDIAAYLEATRRFPVFLAIFQKFIPAKITEARKWHVDWSKQQTYRRIANPSSRGDMLGFMVDSEGKTSISHDELTAHASQLILGGAETMTGMLVGTTYFLAKTPRVQQFLQKEIREAFESVDDITAAKLSTMKYLTAVIHEGLRSFPPGPTGLPRYSPGALVDGHFVPKGTKVSTHPWTVTHSEEYWDKPDEFRPERWLEEGNKDVKDASVPFGLGTRQCLGQNIAWVEMRLYLAKMMWLYNLELVDKERDWVKDCKTYFMWMKTPLMIKVERREGF
ncbi:Similar to Isotrichodermin C-15 hydroxylase; acc. no. O13317 [Pyronema omphalodes CBS 100304]|uniref:Similar to Isotrichodermin C-15 hydroxylase acc. no. O13317 n=1 Tax=Pyronema omphalodes (strain CBS 100304) TaxID=1076935 RepID=U4LLK3_PYROM|nr:Similar to Isotrichodermin C-15 hydroxylase; acc. no. O13317 [Pyronema omphalodes CBS 100304]